MDFPNKMVLVTGGTEVCIAPANARLVKIIPQGTTTGTITIREAAAIGSGNTPKFTVAVPQAAAIGGVEFSPNGVDFNGGLCLTLSVAGDVFGVIWGMGR